MFDTVFRFVLIFFIVGVGFLVAHLLADTPEEVTQLLLVGLLVLVVNLSIDVWTLKEDRKKDHY